VAVALFTVTSYDKSMQRKATSRPRKGRPASENALTPAERMRALRQRRKAAGLKEVVRWVPTSQQPPVVYSSHQLLDARSLAMHALIAAKIDKNRELLAIPQTNLARWENRWGESTPRWLSEWRQILSRPWNEVAAILVSAGENATRLRQSSPFAGVLTPTERLRIYAAFRP